MKKKLINKILVGALVFTSILPLAGNVPAYAKIVKHADWEYKDGKLRYYGNWSFDWKDGMSTEGPLKDQWTIINKHWYHFNKDGIMDRNTTIKDE